MTHRSHFTRFSQSQGHYHTFLSFMTYQGITSPKEQKIPTQKDLDNEASITSCVMIFKGRAGIGC